MNKRDRTLAAKMRHEFLCAVDGIVEYWQNETRASVEDRIRGVAFSVLVLLDNADADSESVFRLTATRDHHSEDPKYLPIGDGVELHSEFCELEKMPRA